MTKAFKYVKIKFMKTQKIFKTKITIILFLSLVLAFSALGLISVNKVKGATAVSPELVLPSSNLEYYELHTPIDAYSDQDITAILQEGKLIFYSNGVYDSLTDTLLEQAKQIKKFDTDTLLLSSGTITRKFTVSTKTLEEFKINNNTIGSTFFDFNSNYFVTSAGTTVKIFSFNGGNDDKIQNTFTDSPVAINSNNEIFYVRHNKLEKQKINSSTYTELADAVPSMIIANNEYVYYLLNTDIYRISVNGGEPQRLTKPQSIFDLGKITTPTSIAFKGENILITGDDAVQEFRVLENGELEFTGFAIAKGKTAYNRISSTVKEIERQKDTLATLDGDKLSLININGEFNSYSTENFIHYTKAQLTDNDALYMPSSFALGESSALLLYDNTNNSDDKIGIFTLGLTPTLDYNLNTNNVKDYTDVAYQSGNYYLLAHENISSSTIFTCSEDNVNFSPLTTINVYASLMEIDVFGNVYLFGNGKVYKLDKSNEYQKTELADIAGVKKLETDLGGNLFALTDSAVKLYTNGVWVETSFTTSGLKSFAMDYDKKSVYMIYDNEELIVKTQSLNNLAIDDIPIPQDFILTAENATSSTFRTFIANENANVYSVSKSINGKFSFNELIIERDNYAFISQINLGVISLYALVGQDDVVLINASEVTENTPPFITEVPQSAFITTNVSGYYLPIITSDGEYALSNSEKVIRLAKEQLISPKHKLTFLDKEYYFAEFTINETTYTGYIPISYTVEVLSQDFKWDKYSLEEVSKTTVYKDKELTTSLIELKNGTSIRLIDELDGVSYIAFSTDGGWVNGYIKSSAIKDDTSIAIRNILIIIAVLASVCGTTTYFILRKKK